MTNPHLNRVKKVHGPTRTSPFGLWTYAISSLDNTPAPAYAPYGEPWPATFGAPIALTHPYRISGTLDEEARQPAARLHTHYPRRSCLRPSHQNLRVNGLPFRPHNTRKQENPLQPRSTDLSGTQSSRTVPAEPTPKDSPRSGMDETLDLRIAMRWTDPVLPHRPRLAAQSPEDALSVDHSLERGQWGARASSSRGCGGVVMAPGSRTPSRP